jgi:hypothetical protein
MEERDDMWFSESPKFSIKKPEPKPSGPELRCNSSKKSVCNFRVRERFIRWRRLLFLLLYRL